MKEKEEERAEELLGQLDALWKRAADCVLGSLPESGGSQEGHSLFYEVAASLDALRRKIQLAMNPELREDER